MLAHHFTQAGQIEAAIEWWGKAGDQALRRSAFQEAISHLGKAIEMADRVDNNSDGRWHGLEVLLPRKRRLPTHHSSERTLSDERLTAYMASGLPNLMGGELGMAREIAEIFRREADNAGRITETAVGLRYLGLTCGLQGELREAEANLVRALELYDPERDREANLRYGVDTRAGALAYLASVKWGLGEIAPVRGLSEEAIAHALGTGHVPTIAGVYQSEAVLESVYGDAAATRRTAETVLELGQQHKLAVYVAWGQIFSGWAREKLGEREDGTAQLQRGLMALTELGTKGGAVYPQGLLAEIEAQGQQVEGALARIDEALALAQQTGERWSEPFLHRVRGEILLKRDPANTAPAEDAFLTAIAIARQQKARSFELPAAMALAKLYQSEKRVADAHAVLAAALEGFVPTPELPRIEEAQALLTALAEADEVKRAAAARERRLKLQTAYGLAVAWSKGFAAEETKAAFTRASELSASTGHSDEQFTTLYGRWVTSLLRGELDRTFHCLRFES